MTAIAGLVDKNIVWIGGDSLGVEGTNLSCSVRDDPKVFHIGDQFIMGCTTSFRMIQLLQYKLDPPQQTTNQSDIQYMVVSFIDSCKKLFENDKFDQKGNEGGQFLVGYKSALYAIDSDYQVGIMSCGYHAIGCGGKLALGSLYTTQNMSLSPKDRIQKALSAASTFSAGVRPPFLILNSANKKSIMVK